MAKTGASSSGKPTANVAGEKFIAKCHACQGPRIYPLPRYEVDGKVYWFDPTCLGGWLMSNPDSVAFFYTGQEQPELVL